MTQLQLDRQIAAATGESLTTVQHRGFSIVDPQHVDFDGDNHNQGPQWIDWDDELTRR